MTDVHPARMRRIDCWIALPSDRLLIRHSEHLARQLMRALLDTPGVRPVAPPLTHAWPGGGAAVVVLLEESHAALHSWPEHGVCWVELATCGGADSLVAFVEACERHIGRRVNQARSPQQLPGRYPGADVSWPTEDGDVGR